MNTVDKIVDLIKAKGITEKKFLSDLSFNRTLLSDWKSQKSKSYTKHIQKIADYFGVTTDYLLNGSDNKKSSDMQPEDDYQFALLDGSKELTDEGKKELVGYLEYLKNKYKK